MRKDGGEILDQNSTVAVQRDTQRFRELQSDQIWPLKWTLHHSFYPHRSLDLSLLMSGSVSSDVILLLYLMNECIIYCIYCKYQRGCFQLLYMSPCNSDAAAAITEDLSRKTVGHKRR